jgi:hypothetical protein
MALFLETKRKQDKIRRDIIMKRGYSITIHTNPPDTSIFKQTVCPHCDTPVCFWSHGKESEHRCTVCGGFSTF